MELLKRYDYPLEAVEVQKLVKLISDGLSISPLEAIILVNRGFVDIDASKKILDKSINGLHSPLLMLDAEKAAKAIVDKIIRKLRIVFYSDYDADGWGSAVVAIKMFEELGIDIAVYTNHRSMGYGICKDGIDDIVKKYPDVKMILTADNGIVAFEAIDYANSLGIEVVVTDHHQPSSDGKIPNALAVVNPHRLDDSYPFPNLCGAAVIWKVMTIVFYLMGVKVNKAKDYLDIVATSTVADVVELVGENRIIVDYGLSLISNNSRVQWEIFKKVFSDFSKIDVVNTRTIGFTFGPAINAVSRMEGSIDKAIEIFRLTDKNAIFEKVSYLKNVNKQRKLLTTEDFAISMGNVSMQASNPIIVVTNEFFQEGLVGLVSGRIKELLNKPAIVLTKDHEGNWKGSGRSIEGYHIKDALDRVQDKYGILAKYGGHSQACGLTVEDSKLEDFKMYMLEDAWDIPDELFIKVIKVDYQATESEIDDSFFDKVKNLEPYGKAFEEPIIGLENFEPLEVKFIGADNQHLVLKGKNFDVVSWYGAEKLGGTIPKKFTLCGRLDRDDFGIKLMVDPDNIII